MKLSTIELKISLLEVILKHISKSEREKAEDRKLSVLIDFDNSEFSFCYPQSNSLNKPVDWVSQTHFDYTATEKKETK